MRAQPRRRRRLGPCGGALRAAGASGAGGGVGGQHRRGLPGAGGGAPPRGPVALAPPRGATGAVGTTFPREPRAPDGWARRRQLADGASLDVWTHFVGARAVRRWAPSVAVVTDPACAYLAELRAAPAAAAGAGLRIHVPRVIALAAAALGARAAGALAGAGAPASAAAAAAAPAAALAAAVAHPALVCLSLSREECTHCGGLWGCVLGGVPVEEMQVDAVPKRACGAPTQRQLRCFSSTQRQLRCFSPTASCEAGP